MAKAEGVTVDIMVAKTVWCLSGEGRRSLYSTEQRARTAMFRDMIKGQQEHLDSCLADLEWQRAWAAFLGFETDVMPERTIWETREYTDQKIGDPKWRMEALQGLRERIKNEERRAEDFRARIRALGEGHDYSDEWGYSIKKWTVDSGRQYE